MAHYSANARHEQIHLQRIVRRRQEVRVVKLVVCDEHAAMHGISLPVQSMNWLSAKGLV